MNVVERLANDWRESGISEGDTILIHSNTRRTFRRYLKLGIKITINDILDSFLNAVGQSGTLLLPLFNFEFCKGVPFDIWTTPSRMGALTEAGRQHPNAVRTGHPIYSFAVIGQKSNRFKNVNNISGYGEDSPFAILRELNGKIGVLGLPEQNSMTFYHHIEEMHKVNYRYFKSFTGDYTGSNGIIEKRTYKLFVRNLEQGILTYVDPAGELLWGKGLYTGFRPDDGIGFRVISTNLMYDFISDIIQSGRSQNILYRIGEVPHV